MLVGSKLCIFGQVDAEPRELVSTEGYRSLALTLKIPGQVVGKGWYDVYVSLRNNHSVEVPGVGDWILLWGYSIGRRKVVSKDANLKDYYKTVLRGNQDDLINLNMLVLKGQDYLNTFVVNREERGGVSQSPSRAKDETLEDIMSDIERSL